MADFQIHEIARAGAGYSVFLQKVGGIEITKSGRKFYERLPALLKSVEDILALPTESRTEPELLRLVSFEVFTTFSLVKIVASEFAHWSVEVWRRFPEFHLLQRRERRIYSVTLTVGMSAG